MKRFTALTAAFLLLVTPMTAFAEEPAPAAEEAAAAGEAAPAAPQFSYGLDEEGHAELYDFLESDTFTGDLVIPWEIDGHQVDWDIAVKRNQMYHDWEVKKHEETCNLLKKGA